MPYRRAAETRGFTLVEILVSLAIIVLLAGLLHVGLAPVREKARETHCLNNLHQIAKAIQMYRQDYGGQDPPGALTYAQLGLPKEPEHLISYLSNSWDVFRCPSEYWDNPEVREAKRRSTKPGEKIAYYWHIWDETWPSGELKKFSQRVAARGSDTPLVLDPHHGTFHYGGGKNVKFLVLRLGGQVQVQIYPKLPSAWEL
jgi:prepilin-type N-terminal cleavage/methylation domain-containing protein